MLFANVPFGEELDNSRRRWLVFSALCYLYCITLPLKLILLAYQEYAFMKDSALQTGLL